MIWGTASCTSLVGRWTLLISRGQSINAALVKAASVNIRLPASPAAAPTLGHRPHSDVALFLGEQFYFPWLICWELPCRRSRPSPPRASGESLVGNMSLSTRSDASVAQERVFSFDVPRGAVPGDVCKVNLPDGTCVEVTLPPGMRADGR